MCPALQDNHALKCPCSTFDRRLATVVDLPVELLIQVFISLTETSGDYPLAPLLLSQVCRFWRDVVLHLPHVWRCIFLHDTRPVAVLQAQANLWAVRSLTHSLDIHVHLTHGDNLLPLLSPLLAHIRRWRRCKLTGKIEEDIDFGSFSEEGSLAVLDNLSVNIRSLFETEEALVASSTSRAPTFDHGSPLHPGSHTSRFHRVYMNAEVSRLPLTRYMSAVNLRSLVIRETSLEVVPDPVRLINFLSCFPELRVLHYYGFPHEPSPPKDRSAALIAHLPRLHTVVLRSICAVRAVLSHIDAPELVELYLEHTNMEFELHHAAAFTADPEDGDSEDENHDFSQSPWSDHATGMGLRSLIRRSKPPLEVLEMDYADMRTKDFMWCFDHLETLQEFRIVASDMSDKVIALFAPFRPGLGCQSLNDLDVEEAPSASTADSTIPLHVRLPKLSALELRNCQRLSGDAVVDALGARVRFTDKVTDRNAYAKLSDVAIVNCANFLPRHVMTLSPVLGTRLRTTE
ncbi:uncharacterized protein PHACADRAFT_261810 [Phanerochaete carnosa HHB-10118-sp]|uniref:F-box domain-containing protein n=1 Tax=Phanerochaete carnosa (strain HHB-10118-sp) TaxID=650164 RepID=K5UP85_PHACS|nr:uncharacterized protein PHACADRAFT_261810 [Phanerochaete carnosa HHB-10118-sp]EKM51581.1 hypothetical protein PHACADRAFT_261810 [Phanerochaete carnosa HHB-10118-sp]